MTNTLNLRFLGAPTVHFQDQLLRFRSRKVLALLIYLAVEGGFHRREKLITMFWPESDPKKGNVTFRSTLSRLKKSLAPAGDYILVEAGGLSFDSRQPYQLDLQQLQTVLQEGSQTGMQAAFSTIRGEFLEGFLLANAPEFDEWATIQRESWHRRIEQGLEKMSRLQLEQGQHNQAVETAVQWVSHALYNEAAYKRLIESHAINGDRSAALLVYEQCRRVLHDELGILPSTNLTDLVDRIRSQTFVNGRSEVDRPAEEVSRPSSELPFVGRAAEYQQLISAFQQSRAHQPQVVMLVGEAGLGKTRLSRTFLDWVAISDGTADLLSGHGHEMGGRLPFQPVVEALRVRLERENAPDDLLADVWLAELSQLLPELRDRYPDLPLPFSGDAGLVRSRIFEAVARFGEALARKGVVVIFIDDVQWADEGSLDLLHYLAQRWRELHVPIFLLLTLRQEPELESNALQDWMNRLSRDASAQILNLKPLDLTSLRLLLNQMAGTSLSDEAVQQLGGWLYKETQGQPFFLSEMLQMLVERNLLVYRTSAAEPVIDVPETMTRIEAEGHLPIPLSIHELILARLRRLGESARAVLLAAAVLGRDVTFEQLTQVSALDEMEGLRALDALLHGRLLLENNNAAHPYTFTHNKIREVVTIEAGETRRRIYHRRALAVLAENGAPAAELAYHALAARQFEPAFHYSLDAGEAAMRASALSEAIQHFDQAHALSQQGVIEDQILIRLYQSRGRALEVAHRFEEALENYEELAELAGRTRNPNMLLASLMAQANLFVTPTPLRNLDKGQSYSEQALELAQRLADRRTEAKLLWGMLLLYHYGLGDEEKARDYGEASLAIARELDLNETLAYALNDLHWVYISLGDFRQAQIYLEEAVMQWRRLHNIPMLLDSLNGSGISYSIIGDFDQALAAVQEGVELAESIHNTWNQISIQANLLWVYRERGEYGQIISILQAAIELAQMSLPVTAVYFQSSLALIYSDLGLLKSAASLCDQILAQSKDAPAFWRLEELVYAVQSRLALIRGDLPAARKVIEKSGIEVDDIGIAHATLITTAVRCELALAEVAIDRALQLAEASHIILQHSGVRIGLADAYYYKGCALLSKGRFDEAQEALHRAHMEAAALKARRIQWKILAALAEVNEQLNEVEAAQLLRDEAHAVLKIVIDHVPEGEMRAAFMKLPEVSTFL